MVILGYNQNNTVLAVKKEDVTGDKIVDEIYLTGYKKKPEDILVRNINLVVEEGRSKQIIRTAFPLNEGTNPRLFTGDFNCDGVSDVLVCIDTAGSGGCGNFYLYSFKNNQTKLLFDLEKFKEELSYEVDFKENFTVIVYCRTLNKKHKIDVADRKAGYQDIYSRNGKLLKPVNGSVSGLHAVYPVDKRGGCFNILAVQRVTGLHDADLLGYLETIFKWERTKFIPEKQFISRFRYYISKGLL